MIVRDWKDAKQWSAAARRPAAAARALMAGGHGLLLPILFGQSGIPALRELRKDLETSSLFTTFNKTTHLCQVSDIVTTAVMAATGLGIRARTLDIVASGGTALRAFVAWAFLCSRLPVGNFIGDLGGMDLADPDVWAAHAYVPLVLMNGGIRCITALCAGRKAVLSGVPRSARALFPKSFQIIERPQTLEQLLFRSDSRVT